MLEPYTSCLIDKLVDFRVISMKKDSQNFTFTQIYMRISIAAQDWGRKSVASPVAIPMLEFSYETDFSAIARKGQGEDQSRSVTPTH